MSKTSKRGAAKVQAKAAPKARGLRECFVFNIKAHRAAAKLSQEQVAQKANLSVSYVSMLERGTRAGTFETAEALAGAFQVDPRELFAP